MLRWFKVVIIRHSESEWNKLNKFTGWYNAPLTPKGIIDTYLLSKKLKLNKIYPDIIFTSKQVRALETTRIIRNELDLNDCEIIKTCYLNERHYGNLTGYKKEYILKKYGQQAIDWRTSYTIKPPIIPKLDISIANYNYPFYEIINDGESIEMTYNRSKRTWDYIFELGKEKKVLVVSHSNTIKSLLKNTIDIDLKTFKLENSQVIKFNYTNCLKRYKIEII